MRHVVRRESRVGAGRRSVGVQVRVLEHGKGVHGRDVHVARPGHGIVQVLLERLTMVVAGHRRRRWMRMPVPVPPAPAPRQVVRLRGRVGPSGPRARRSSRRRVLSSALCLASRIGGFLAPLLALMTISVADEQIEPHERLGTPAAPLHQFSTWTGVQDGRRRLRTWCTRRFGSGCG